MKYLFRSLVIIVASALAGVVVAEEPATHGSICVAPMPEKASILDAETGNRRGYISYKFTVRLDKGKWFEVPEERPFKIERIDLDKKHLLSIRDGDQLIESFWFTFNGRGGADLCLSYKPWYQTWLLEPPRNRPWCKCKNGD